MPDMKHSTHTVVINAPFDIAWDYISNWQNQPAWATNFVKSVRLDGDQIMMTTIMGEAPIEWLTNRDVGTIDIGNQDGTVTPSRLVNFRDHVLYMFTFSMPQHVPEPVFKDGQIGMDEELSNLKHLIEALVPEAS